MRRRGFTAGLSEVCRSAQFFRYQRLKHWLAHRVGSFKERRRKAKRELGNSNNPANQLRAECRFRRLVRSLCARNLRGPQKSGARRLAHRARAQAVTIKHGPEKLSVSSPGRPPLGVMLSPPLIAWRPRGPHFPASPVSTVFGLPPARTFTAVLSRIAAFSLQPQYVRLYFRASSSASRLAWLPDITTASN